MVTPRLVAKIESEEPTHRLAVLIDADNAQAAVIEGLLAEIARYGEATVRRIYGTQSTLYQGQKVNWYSLVDGFRKAGRDHRSGHLLAIRKGLAWQRRHLGDPAEGTPALPETSRPSLAGTMIKALRSANGRQPAFRCLL